MTDIPRHPDASNDSAWQAQSPRRSANRHGRTYVIVFAIALLGLMVVLHLTGVFGPASH